VNCGPRKLRFCCLRCSRRLLQRHRRCRGDRLKRSAATLKEVALAAGIPIMASVVPLGERPLELVEGLAGIEPLARSTVGVLDDLAISDRIAALGRRVLILGGVSSEIAMLHAV
jgi:hypothetical protein